MINVTIYFSDGKVYKNRPFKNYWTCERAILNRFEKTGCEWARFDFDGGTVLLNNPWLY